MANLLEMIAGVPQKGGGMLGDPLFHMGLGMLSQTTPSPYPTGIGGAAQGAMQGMQSHQQYQQNQMLNQLSQAQLGQMQSETNIDQQIRAKAMELARSETDPYMKALAQSDPNAYLRIKTGAGQSAGNTPIWGQDENGNWVLGRFTPKGFEQITPPEGVNLLPVAQDPSLAGQRAGATEQARADVQEEMNPRIAYGTEMAKVDAFVDSIDRVGDAEALKQYKVNVSGIEGTSMGEAKTLLADMEANMPNLQAKVEELKSLAPVATYTYLGLGRDWVLRQTGMGPGESGVARARYISIVDNEMLPLLKQTFGASFTAQEGESLKATLGSPNYSPEEKAAVIESFINAKIGQINSLQTRIKPVSEMTDEELLYGP